MVFQSCMGAAEDAIHIDEDADKNRIRLSISV